ncbi:UNVERIFIED_CONTAM: 39S ribosomal protein L47, mitochondrial [Sesamum latifolium]|uniref:Large ribosomal subunit protein uL29m n=1 Tax=Sesamum latifolium TaxID=2727402 RepID=A0AAW2UIK9_9LAMI
MFLTRVFGRTLFAAAKSEASAAAAASSTTWRNPLEEFFEADRNPEDEKPVVYGRSWKASELRLKSWDDLQKLWYVLLKEKNMLMTQRQMLHAQNLRFPNPERLPKVRKSMCRIKHVLTERAMEEADPRRLLVTSTPFFVTQSVIDTSSSMRSTMNVFNLLEEANTDT